MEEKLYWLLDYIINAVETIGQVLLFYITEYIIYNENYREYVKIVSEWVIDKFNKFTFYFELDIELYDLYIGLIGIFYIVLLLAVFIRVKRIVRPKGQRKRKELTKEEKENYKLEMERYEKELIEEEAKGGKQLDKKLKLLILYIYIININYFVYFHI